MAELSLGGSIPALVTPFADGAVDHAALRDLVDWQIAQGSSAIVVCGTTGEAASMGEDERAAVVASATAVAAGRVAIIAGTSSNDTRTAVRLTGDAERAGADATLHATGYYIRPSAAQIVGHYAAVAGAARRPVLVYDIPARTGVTIDLPTLLQIARLPGIGGIKDSTASMTRLSQQRISIGGPFSFLTGDDFSALGYLAHGRAGVISVTANVAPALCACMCELAADGDFVAARVVHERLLPLHKALMAMPNPAGAKYALATAGRCRNELRQPLTSVSAEVAMAIDEALAALVEDAGMLIAGRTGGRDERSA